MDVNQGSLRIMTDNGEEEEIYKEIPTDKPLFAAVLIKDSNDLVEITDFHKDYIKLINEKKEKEKKEENKKEKK